MANSYWEPDKLLEKLTINARVRVRPSAECVCSECGESMHPMDSESGIIVKIIRDAPFIFPPCRHAAAPRGHRYLVQSAHHRGLLAALELIPLEAESDTV